MNQEPQNKDLDSTVFLLHMTLYSYQKSIDNIVGNGSRAILTFGIPYLMEILRYGELSELNKSKSIDENMTSYLSIIKKNGIKDAKLKRESENVYSFEIKECDFAQRNHKIFKSDSICPFAIVAAAIVFYKTEAHISIQESILNKQGSKTMFTLHEKIRDNIS